MRWWNNVAYLQAPSKESVVCLCNEAFMLRNAKVYPKAVTSSVKQMLSLQSDIQAHEVFYAVFVFIVE